MNAVKKKFVLGITGLPGSGKTEAAKKLRKAGYCVVNADRIGHGIYKKGSGLYGEIVKKYGHGVLNKNGEINRRALAGAAFKDEKSYLIFSKMVFPCLVRGVKAAVKKSRRARVAVDMAVLFECGFYKETDAVIFISRKKRFRGKNTGASARKFLSLAEQYQKIFGLAKKIALSDYIIYNNGSRAVFYKKIIKAARAAERV